MWNPECDGCMNDFSSRSPRLWQGQYQGPPVTPFSSLVPSSPGNPIWVITVKSVRDVLEKQRERGWQCGTKSAAIALFPAIYSLHPIPNTSTHTHFCTVHLSYTTFSFFSHTLPSFSSSFCFLNPSGRSEEREMQTRGKMEGRKSKWGGMKVAVNRLHQQNSVSEHEPFWLETWKQEVKRNCQDLTG